MVHVGQLQFITSLIGLLSFTGLCLCLSTSELAEFLPYGLPSHDNLRLFDKYMLSYDRRFKEPIWVMEHLTPKDLPDGVGVERDSGFREDQELHPYFRSKNKDYRQSSYDKGHLAPAGDFNLDKEASSESFILSNIAPQTASLNRGPWLRLENYVRSRAKESDNLYVVSGPLYMPIEAEDGKKYLQFEVIGDSNVGVPTHYYKVILAEKKRPRGKPELTMEAFIMPNTPEIDKQASIEEYRISIDELPVYEQATGLIFFNRVKRSEVKTVV